MSHASRVLASVSACVFLLSLTNRAQAQEDAPLAEVTVTGTHIVRGGYEAPTPTIATTADALQMTSPQGLTQGLNKLPVFAGSQTQAGSVTGGLGSGGVNLIGSFLNLRNFGSVRSLILLDGRRVAPTNFSGDVDVDTIPQALVQRVDVVTGGASAVYGSDAVTGVVNYVLDHKFTGWKSTLQAGKATAGDDFTRRINVAFGTDLFGGGGHLLLSAESFKSDGIDTKEARDWYRDQLLAGNGTAAAPYNTIERGRTNTASFGGYLRVSGTQNANLPAAMRNTTFNPDGTLKPFDRGVVSNTAGFSSGGDGSYHAATSLLASLKTNQAFARFEYDLTDNLNGFVQASFSDSQSFHTQATANRSDTGTSRIVIYSGNPYLRPEIQALLTASNVASFTVSEYGIDLGRPLFEINTRSPAATLGLSGKVLDHFKWDVGYTHGEGRTEQVQHQNSNNAHFYAAVDAVDEGTFKTGVANGNIVCRVSLTSPGSYPGCVPINVMGRGNATAAAIAYTTNDTAWTATNKMDDISATITGDVFDNWAGPVSLALGAEYRHQSLLQTTTDSPLTVPDFTGLRGGFTSATLSYVGVLVAGAEGTQDVSEENLEVVFPLLKDAPATKTLDFTGAVRNTHYRTSGGEVTWKAGLEWMPLDDLRFRVVRSRDIRAPTLYDLFAATQVRNTGLVDPLTGVSATSRQIQGGNPDLVPEIADTYTAGFVFSPAALPGFNASIDYFNIKIDNAIGTVDTQTQIRECVASGGTSPFCANVTRPFPISNTTAANYPTSFFTRQINAALTSTEGFDLETSYRTPLDRISLPGSIGLRVLASYQPHLKIQTYSGAAVLDYAGVGDRFARTRVTTELTYNVGGFTGTILDRAKSGGRLNANPALVYTDKDLGSYNVVDLTLSYDWVISAGTAQTFLAANNVFDRDPRIFANDSPGQITPVAADDDVIGRYVTAGVRIKF